MSHMVGRLSGALGQGGIRQLVQNRSVIAACMSGPTGSEIAWVISFPAMVWILSGYCIKLGRSVCVSASADGSRELRKINFEGRRDFTNRCIPISRRTVQLAVERGEEERAGRAHV
jgi:hypothetical protein